MTLPSRRLAVFAVLFGLLASLPSVRSPLVAQEKSVKPGINDQFRDPDPEQFRGRFEVESREVFARRKEIVAACQLKPGLVVADVGAGTGLFTRPFAEAVGREGRVFAVDIAQKFLDHVVKTCGEAGLRNVQPVLAKPDSTELPADSVDVAFICDTYHHFEFPQKTLATLHRALKPGGRLILIDFRRVEGRSTDWVLSHVRAGQEVFEAEVTQAGFRKSREAADLLQENYFVEFVKAPAVGLKPLEFPLIKQFGGIVPLPKAAEPPKAGGKLLLDVTADSKPEALNKGLERAARLINLYGAAGLQASDVRIAVVLHGEATRAVLTDAAFQSRTGLDKNPNLPLARALREAGVELFVCGQALNYKSIDDAEVSPEFTTAAAALTVVVNRQAEGFAYAPVP